MCDKVNIILLCYMQVVAYMHTVPCSNRIILGILWTGVMSNSASVWREHSGLDSFACSIIIMHKMFSPKKSSTTTAGNLPRSKPHEGRP